MHDVAGSVENQGRIVSAHQPLYLPWLGFLHKVASADIFCLMDTIPFEPNSFQHRNRIYNAARGEEKWLEVPVLGDARTFIHDVRIDQRTSWAREHWDCICEAYESAPHFSLHAPFFEKAYAMRWEYLGDFNMHLISGLLRFFDISVPLVRASDVGIFHTSEENIHVALAKRYEAMTYLSGAGKCLYLDAAALHRAGITHIIQQFTHPVYTQGRQKFVPGISAIDVLFRIGPEAKHLL